MEGDRHVACSWPLPSVAGDLTPCACLSPGPLPSAGQAAPVLWALHGPAHHPRPTLSMEPPWPGSCPWVGAGPTHRLPRVSLYTAGRPASELGLGVFTLGQVGEGLALHPMLTLAISLSPKSEPSLSGQAGVEHPPLKHLRCGVAGPLVQVGAAPA